MTDERMCAQCDDAVADAEAVWYQPLAGVEPENRNRNPLEIAMVIGLTDNGGLRMHRTCLAKRLYYDPRSDEAELAQVRKRGMSDEDLAAHRSRLSQQRSEAEAHFESYLRMVRGQFGPEEEARVRGACG